MGNCRQHDAIPKRKQLTVDTSPFTYTNTSGNDETIVILDGVFFQFLYSYNDAGDLFNPSFRGELNL